MLTSEDKICRRWCINYNVCLFLCVQFIQLVFTEVHSCTVVQYVHELRYDIILCPCVCPVHISKKGTWFFPVPGKEIWDFFG